MSGIDKSSACKAWIWLKGSSLIGSEQTTDCLKEGLLTVAPVYNKWGSAGAWSWLRRNRREVVFADFLTIVPVVSSSSEFSSLILTCWRIYGCDFFHLFQTKWALFWIARMAFDLTVHAARQSFTSRSSCAFSRFVSVQAFDRTEREKAVVWSVVEWLAIVALREFCSRGRYVSQRMRRPFTMLFLYWSSFSDVEFLANLTRKIGFSVDLLIFVTFIAGISAFWSSARRFSHRVS